uniref:Uncharacterized protein n=1 Tax=Entomoneis paludosa TaxID=265537 RepID=A0A7S2VAL1_9STRA
MIMMTCIRQWLFLAAVTLLISSASAQSSRVHCQLEITLDDQPHETAWEIRGPIPGVAIVRETEYNHYQTGQTTIRESFFLEKMESYYLILVDEGEDGIKEGMYSVSCRFGSYDRILLTGKADYGDGGIFKFQVEPPAQQRQQQPVQSQRRSSFWPF